MNGSNGTQMVPVNTGTGEMMGGGGYGGDVAPAFVVDIHEAEKRQAMLEEYVRRHMVKGRDIMVIPGTKGMSLLKPGAEKLCAMFGFAIIPEIIETNGSVAEGFIKYTARVRLVSKAHGYIAAEGLGSCNSAERRYANQIANGKTVLADLDNTLLKMAVKRAVIAATLAATRSSGLFDDAEEYEAERSPLW